MKKLKLLLNYAFVAILSLQSLAFLAPSSASAATIVNPSYLISDSIFDNTNAMSAAQIDTLLDSNGGSCIREASGFRSPDPLGFNGSGYAFGGNVTAGKSIYDIAQNYHINPQVIIATLQKEQSIITGGAGCHYDKPNPTDPAQVFACDLYGTGKMYRCTQACPFSYGGGCMNIAMSNGCPGNCNVDDELFQVQISGGTWQLKFSEERAYGKLTGYPGYDSGDENYTYSGPMTPGYRQRVASGPSIYYDGTYTTQDGTSTTITNGGTASLYTYTPYLRGNQSFVNDFEGFGFGDPSSGSCTGNESPLGYVVRYYNPRTYEHWYTAYDCDQNFLNNIGFQRENPVFNTTNCSYSFAVPVYRYYNPKTGLHMWDTGNYTQAQLDAGGTGYRVEAGKVFCVLSKTPVSGGHPVVRFYNPKTYLHFWAGSPSQNDINFLSGQAGYTQQENAVWYTQ